jgi:hypothetical protein
MANSVFKEQVIYILLKGEKRRHITNVEQQHIQTQEEDKKESEEEEESFGIQREFSFSSLIPQFSVSITFSNFI